MAALAGDGRQASVFTQGTVPPFAAARLTLSHLALAATSATSSAPPDFLDAVLPIRPTPQRAFQRTADAVAFLRVYQGTRRTDPLEPVAVRMRAGAEHLTVALLTPLGSEVAMRGGEADAPREVCHRHGGKDGGYGR